MISPRAGWKAHLSETGVYLYQGNADETMPVTHPYLYAKAIPHARIRVFPGRNHQLDNDLRAVADHIRLRR